MIGSGLIMGETQQLQAQKGEQRSSPLWLWVFEFFEISVFVMRSSLGTSRQGIAMSTKKYRNNMKVEIFIILSGANVKKTSFNLLPDQNLITDSLLRYF